jgi:hypothetical protein
MRARTVRNMHDGTYIDASFTEEYSAWVRIEK